MNNPKNYIKLNYTEDGYEIFTVTKEQTTQLSQKSAKIMYKTLKKYKCQQIDENTYIYPDFIPIILSFYRERNRANKSKQVNRNKSKNIIKGTIAIVIIASTVAGISHHVNMANKSNKNTNKSTIIYTDNSNPKTEFEHPTFNTDNEALEETSNSNEIYIEEFHYEYDDFHYYTDPKAVEQAMEHSDLFEKYGNKYGIDVNLLYAISAKESSGLQSSTNGSAYGIMGIEDVWKNGNVKVYNFETEQYETITVDYEKVKNDTDYCIMVGAAIFQQHFYATINSGLINDNEALAYALQRYNMGPTRMQDIVASGEHWMDGRKKEDKGNKSYFEQVLTGLENKTTINLKIPDKTIRSFSIINDTLLELEKENGHSHTNN